MAPPAIRAAPVGSSPLARGLLADPLLLRLVLRIIPARAGFTEEEETNIVNTEDHPRSRGVYLSSLALPSSLCGSSPLARGLLGHGVAQPSELRIIPARAGFTSSIIYHIIIIQDHPRSRGVYGVETAEPGADRGSSPLARGLPVPGRRQGDRAWIIPARAGFTQHARAARLGAEDHPRSRGVYGYAPCETARPAGSSPLARGLRIETILLRECARIIPARAGFTFHRGHGRRGREDHPRSRGVYKRRGRAA